ncbi:hypothetical protein [Nannocystis radixulma]|uniref:PDZ domain-containing protein n=1 Tax=Nannocystis radixulma TaxID=2995305 RepID=A0ABT5BAV9_9BACT|nr:hypothetical protein [Nannocystis radixulma]MDC0670780.1 hypothetical protein [Nannocystis radixulma]
MHDALVAALKRLRTVAEKSATAGFADLAARAWAAEAELLEAGPHSDHERTAVWDNLRSELAKLPAEHRLRRRLAVDLAVFEAAHARHATPAGSCPASTDKFGACEAVHRAIDDLTLALRDESDAEARAWLTEQLAQAHEQAGDVAAAIAVRKATGHPPDSRTPAERGYLEFGRGEVVPHVAGPADLVRCTYDHSRCEVDPIGVSGDIDPSGLLEGAWFMPRIKGGQFNGFVVMNARNSDVMRRIDLRTRDRILAVDGVPVVAPEFAWDLSGALNRGRLALTIERDGVTLEREFVLRRP